MCVVGVTVCVNTTVQSGCVASRSGVVVTGGVCVSLTTGVSDRGVSVLDDRVPGDCVCEVRGVPVFTFVCVVCPISRGAVGVGPLLSSVK